MTDIDLPSQRSVSRRASEIHHGTPGGYRKGCRCRKCTRAKSAQRAEERARRRARDAQRTAESSAPEQQAPPRPPSDPVAEVEPAEGTGVSHQVEAAVRGDLVLYEGTPGAASLSEIALALAREIDEAAGTSVAGAARQLVATLSDLRRLSSKTDDELEKLLGAIGRG